MNESEEDGSGNEDWANDICEVSLWTVGLVGICAVWAVVGDGGIKDADEEKVIVFGLMLWWYFSLIIFALILGKKMMTDLKNLTSQILLSKDSPCKKNHLE